MQETRLEWLCKRGLGLSVEWRSLPEDSFSSPFFPSNRGSESSFRGDKDPEKIGEE